MDQVLEKLQQIEQMLKDQVILSKKVLNISEAAQFLDLSKSAVYRLTSERKISFSKPEGKKLYFKREDLEDWMLSNPIKIQKRDPLQTFRRTKSKFLK